MRGIQSLRKDQGLEVTDRIELTLFGSEALEAAVESYRAHLLSETLAVSWKWEKPRGAPRSTAAEKQASCP